MSVHSAAAAHLWQTQWWSEIGVIQTFFFETGGSAVGASWWQNFVPYEADISSALDRLRWDTYRSGNYFRDEARLDRNMTEAEFIDSIGGLDGDSDGGKQFLLDDWRSSQGREPVTSPDTLLDSQPDSGSHSAIDLYLGVSSAPELFTASPLTNDQLLQAFDSLTPSRAAVESWLDRPTPAIRQRWSGFYVVIYADDAPTEILFAAYSGD